MRRFKQTLITAITALTMISCGETNQESNSYNNELDDSQNNAGTAESYGEATADGGYDTASKAAACPPSMQPGPEPVPVPEQVENNEEYEDLGENPFLDTLKNPLSTFSIDVDTASYSNVRRMINDGYLPNPDAVRIEEFINYFDYDYATPQDNSPIAISTEIASSPWNKENKLVRIGLRGKEVDKSQIPPGNFVFLIDVSGSMSDDIIMVKSAMKLLVSQMRPQDKVSIVVYAGAAGLVLPATAGDKKDIIMNALDRLKTGGSTAGGAGIKLAYKVATDNKSDGSNNRVILITDGDFNVGQRSSSELDKLIEEKRNSGVFLSVMGVGRGNYKDAKMESLSNKGNGNYAYLDSYSEAKKVFLKEFGGSMLVIAKDVKIQVEFNPAKVKSYRLIGYENRALRNEDFEDDKKDAGEIGSNHKVTAFYEVVPRKDGDEQEEQNEFSTTKITEEAKASDNIMKLKLRYKDPDASESKLKEVKIKDADNLIDNASSDFQFASAVAELGLMLRDSKYKGSASYQSLIERATANKGGDPEGYREEMIQLAEKAESLSIKK